MDIFRFIRSNAIKAYLKKINYSFSTPEAAYLIWQSQEIPLKEKFKAWEEVIAHLPNDSMPERMNMMEIKSVHDFLKEYMYIQNKWIEKFNCPVHEVYSYQYHVRVYLNGKWEYLKKKNYEPVYSSLAECKRYLIDEINEYLNANEIYDIYGITVRRHSLKNSNHIIVAHMNVKLEILSIEINDSIPDNEQKILSAFEGMWFDIPTPFKSGDILCKGHFYADTEEAKREEMEPFILCRINTWNTDKKRNFLLQDGDITDMGFSAFYLEKDGDNPQLCWNHGEYYLDLEYYEIDFGR